MDITQEFAGSCQCGNIKYFVKGTPLTLFTCHCKECQKQSASAFGMALWIKTDEIEVKSGTLKTWIRSTPTGNKMACDFCPTCGTRIFHRHQSQTDIISIKPGTLDDTSWLRPVGHIWKNSAQPWIIFDNDSYNYDANPESFDDMIKKFSCDSV